MEKKLILDTIAGNLRTLMKQKGLTSPALAKKSGISQGTISKIVNSGMSITIPMAISLAEGLDVDPNEILRGLIGKNIKGSFQEKSPNKREQLSIGVLSINNKRITCIKNHAGKIIGTSELEGGLDLTETSGNLIQLIQESIHESLLKDSSYVKKLKYAKLNLVTQSYEFEETRNRFILFAKKHFDDVMLLPDWQITYIAAFQKKQGISLVTDKGVSLSFKHNGNLKKLGGWKFPVYDLGGENWLGVETIRHTIDAAEGYIPMSKLAHNVLSKFNGKIERITEMCFRGKDPDVYCLFSEMLLRNYSTGDEASKSILERGYQSIHKLIDRVDTIVGNPLKIAINGSLAEIYKEYFDKERLITPPDDSEKVSILTDFTNEYLKECGLGDI